MICLSLEDVGVAVCLGPDRWPGPLPSSVPPRWLRMGTTAAQTGETTGKTTGETGETTGETGETTAGTAASDPGLGNVRRGREARVAVVAGPNDP